MEEHLEAPVDERRPRLLPIGSFSQACRLSVKALRNYDELGLLRPAFVDPDTGYRYYTLAQANRAEAIRLLRAVDMPLEQIRGLLDERQPARVQEQLQAHRTRMQARLADTQRILGFLQQLIERGEGVMPYDVSIKQVQPQTVLCITAPVDMRAVGPVFGAALGELYGFAQSQGAAITGPPFAVYKDFDEEAATATIQVCVPVAERPAAEPTGRIAFEEVPGGPVAWTLHRGPYDQVRAAYTALYGWMEERGHAPAGPPRETYLNDPGEVPESDLLTEVAWPVNP